MRRRRESSTFLRAVAKEFLGPPWVPADIVDDDANPDLGFRERIDVDDCELGPVDVDDVAPRLSRVLADLRNGWQAPSLRHCCRLMTDDQQLVTENR